MILDHDIFTLGEQIPQCGIIFHGHTAEHREKHHGIVHVFGIDFECDGRRRIESAFYTFGQEEIGSGDHVDGTEQIAGLAEIITADLPQQAILGRCGCKIWLSPERKY